MRLAFVSDIHGSLTALDGVIADMGHRKIQWLVFWLRSVNDRIGLMP